MDQTVNQLLADWMREGFRGADPDGDLAGISVVPAVQAGFGDYQCNQAMAIGKRRHQPPRTVAGAVQAALPAHPAVARLEIAGPGFINIHLSDDWLAARVNALDAAPEAALTQPGAGRTVLLDYSSPNVAKPMHIGHIRSTVIGNALDRLHRALGYRVISDNHLGDWGTQFGIILMGYRHFLDRAALAASPVEELERIYVKSYEKTKEDPAWLDAARAELVKLQSGDADNLALWKQFVALSLGEFQRIYDRLNVRFDLVRGESWYHNLLEGTLERLRQHGLVRESEGAQVVFLEEEKLPPCIVRKSDGGFNYAATDIATVLARVEEFAPEAIVYVTDERQQLHFRQVFAICRRLGVTTRLEHVWFGLMRLPEGTFSTRQGNVIKLERLLDEAEAKARQLVDANSPGMPEANRAEVARAVGIGAVKYADLSQNPQSLVTFSWDKALAMNGNSAPYLQYACARIASVLDKYRAQFPDGALESHPIALTDPLERDLALRLLRFPEAVLHAVENDKPSLLADYLYETAGAYSGFYQNLPFLKAPGGVRESRIRLGRATGNVLRRGLNLLGIETPERI